MFDCRIDQLPSIFVTKSSEASRRKATSQDMFMLVLAGAPTSEDAASASARESQNSSKTKSKPTISHLPSCREIKKTGSVLERTPPILPSNGKASQIGQCCSYGQGHFGKAQPLVTRLSSCNEMCRRNLRRFVENHPCHHVMR